MMCWNFLRHFIPQCMMVPEGSRGSNRKYIAVCSFVTLQVEQVHSLNIHFLFHHESIGVEREQFMMIYDAVSVHIIRRLSYRSKTMT